MTETREPQILFIEDDPIMVDMYTHVLNKHGYQVDITYDGEEGLDQAKQGEYDLILLDIMMPQMLGIEVLKELRGEDGSGLPNTKIVILTNLAQSEESRQAMEAQADGYLIKADITPNKLVELIAQMLGSSDNAGSDSTVNE